MTSRWRKVIRRCAANLQMHGDRIELDERNVDGALALFITGGEQFAIADGSGPLAAMPRMPHAPFEPL